MIKLELTVEEVNIILTSLGRMPYESVYAVIEKIKTEGENQLEQINKVATTKKDQPE